MIAATRHNLAKRGDKCLVTEREETVKHSMIREAQWQDELTHSGSMIFNASGCSFK